MFKISTSKEAIQTSSGGNFISNSGIYDATIKFASIDVSTGGAKSVNFNIDYNGNSQTIYGPYIFDKQGNPLEIGLKLINTLGVIAGMRDGDQPTIEAETHNVGKDNKPQEFNVFTELTDLPIKVRLQEEYAINPNTKEIRKSLVPKAFFSAEGASAAEILAQENGESVTIGKDLEKQQKYADNITYRDSLDADQIAAWKDSKSGNSAKAAPKPTVTNKTAGSLFK